MNAAPINDRIEDAATLSFVLPVSIEADTSLASFEQWEPVIPSLPNYNRAAGSVWYRWVSPTTGSVRAEVLAPDDHAEVRVFLGTTARRLVPPTGSAERATGVYEFPAIAGEAYMIGIYSLNGGNTALALRSAEGAAPSDERSHPAILPATLPSRIVVSASSASAHPGDDPPSAGDTIWWQWTAPIDATCRIVAKSQHESTPTIWVGTDSWSGVGYGIGETYFKAQAGQSYLICSGHDEPGQPGLIELSIEEFGPAPNLEAENATVLPSEIRTGDSGVVVANDDTTYHWSYPVPEAGSYRVTSSVDEDGLIELAIDGGNEISAGVFEVAEGGELRLAVSNASIANSWGGDFSFQIRQETKLLGDLSAIQTDVINQTGGLVLVDSKSLESISWQSESLYAPVYFGGDSSPLWQGWLRWAAPASGRYNLQSFLDDGLSKLPYDRGLALAIFRGGVQLLPLNESAPTYADFAHPYYFNAEAGAEYQIVVYANYYTENRGFEIRVDPVEPLLPNQDPLMATDLPDASTAAFEILGPIDGSAYWHWVAPHDGRLRLTSSLNDPSSYRPLIYLGNPDAGGVAIDNDSPVTMGQTLFIEVADLDWLQRANVRISLQPPRDQLPVANDDFAAATDLGESLPIAARFQTLGASREPEEGQHDVADRSESDEATLWWKWTPVTDGPVAVIVNRHSYAVYTGNSLATLKPVTLELLHESHWYYPRRLDAIAGTTYYIAVQGSPLDLIAELKMIPIQVVAPVNDSFSDRTDLGAGRGEIGFGAHRRYTDGTLEIATISGDDPAGDPALTQSLWYQWRSKKNGIFAVRLNSMEHADITVYQDAESVDDLVEVEGSSVGWDGTQLFPVIDGNSYIIKVANRPMEIWEYTIEIDAANAYEVWARSHPILSGENHHPNANPSGDGFDNLSKLVHGLDPSLNSSPNGNDPNRERAPALSQDPDGTISLRFFLDEDAMHARDGGRDLRVTGRRDTILGRRLRAWGGWYYTPVELGNGWFSLSFSPDEPREFMRIEILSVYE